MLNFNAMDGISQYPQAALSGSLQLANGAFDPAPTATSSCHQSQSNQAFLNNSAKATNWPMNSNHNAVGANLSSSNQNQLNLKNFGGPLNNSGSERAPIEGNTPFLHQQQKGSENVKRFSVNNLLQLAHNSCRVLPNDRLAGTYETQYIKSRIG